MAPLLLPRIRECGYFNSAVKFGERTSSPERVSDCYELDLFLEDGRSTYFDDREIPIRRDRILITPPGCRRWSLLPFRTAYLKWEAEGDMAALLDRLPREIVPLDPSRMRERLQEIIRLWESRPSPDRELSLAIGLLTLTEALSTESAMEREGLRRTYPLMEKVKRFIEAHMEEKISTTDMAAHINLSESRLRALFRETYGISPHQYLTDVRILAAKRMLADTEHSIAAIAEACGFPYQQYFSRIFQRETGMKPGAYRNGVGERYLGNDNI